MKTSGLNTVLLMVTAASALFLAFSAYQLREAAVVGAENSGPEQATELYLSCAATDVSDSDTITPYSGYVRFDGRTLYVLKGSGDGDWEPTETDIGGAIVTGSGEIVWSGEQRGYVNASLKLDRFTLAYTVLGQLDENSKFPGYPVYGDGSCVVVHYKVGS